MMDDAQVHKMILDSIYSTIMEEANALKILANTKDHKFVEAIICMQKCSGRLVWTGIGKSAIVAQKIVATLNSTGTSALFMHAADAIHGDLGMICEDDIVICISKSGETSEIKALLPLIKGFGNTLIGMTSQISSRLAIESDLVIMLPMDMEADPNNLAPTTSTTLQMAMGDAIAICLLKLRGFSPAQFAKLHPGGNLGKQMYLRIADMVDYKQRPRTYMSDDLKKIIYEISSKRFGATAVLDDNENLIGIITDGDLRRMLENTLDLNSIKAADIVQKNPKICQFNDMAIEALQTLKEEKIQQLIVVDGLKYIGMVHLHDFFREGLY